MFFTCLAHYLKGNKIRKANRSVVELCIFIEAGATVCGMDPMKMEKKEQAYFNKYMGILDEIKEDQIVNEFAHNAMCHKYKKGKKNNTRQSLWRKYKTKLTEWQLIRAAKWFQPAKAYKDVACPGTLDRETPGRVLLVFFAAMSFNKFFQSHYNFAFRMKRALTIIIPLLCVCVPWVLGREVRLPY